MKNTEFPLCQYDRFCFKRNCTSFVFASTDDDFMIATKIIWCDKKNPHEIPVPSCVFHLPGFCFRSPSCKINLSDFFRHPIVMLAQLHVGLSVWPSLCVCVFVCVCDSRAQLVERMWTLFNTIRDHKDATGRQLSLIFVKLPSKLVSSYCPGLSVCCLHLVQGLREKLILRFSSIKSEINIPCQKFTYSFNPNRMTKRTIHDVGMCTRHFFPLR